MSQSSADSMRKNQEKQRVKPINELSRREFLAASSAAVAATASGLAIAESVGESSKSPLAVDGGPKTVHETFVPEARWGEPERERLNAALAQNTMFYWQGPQTALFTNQFREVC